MFKDKVTQSVADAAAKIMAEELKGNQKKIDKNHNGKIDGQDLKMLRKEDAEQILEYESKDGKFVHKAKPGNYGGSDAPKDPFAAVRGPKHADLSAIEAEKRKKKKKFSEMVDTYQAGGIKELFKEMAIEEEASQEEFTAELEKQKKKAAGTATDADKAEVAKPAVQAVQQEEVESIEEDSDDDYDEYGVRKTSSFNTPPGKKATPAKPKTPVVTNKKSSFNTPPVKEETEIQVINADIANGVDQVNIEERSLTPAEEKTKEHNVKSMKKNIAGFKERYGKDAKSVMYATATKQAKGE